MRLTKLGHACVQITDGEASVIIDPGRFSPGFEDLRGLSAILVTHQHFDHLEMDRIGALVEANPRAVLVADRDTAAQLGERGIPARVVSAGDVLDADGLRTSLRRTACADPRRYTGHPQRGIPGG